MTGIRVHIPTTEGPSEIQRITLEDPDVRAVVGLDGKAVALPISADYDAFVRAPTGVIEAGFGHSAFRLDASQEITEGVNWQLAAYADHALHAADRLAMREQAAHRVIWLTGEVDCALNIRPVRHVARKLRQSGRLIADLATAGMPLTIYIPRENHAELDDETLLVGGIDDLNCRIVPVDQISHVLADLRLPARRKSGYSASAPKSAKWSPWVTAPLAVLAGLTVLAVGASLTAPQKNIAAIQPPASLLTRVSMTAGPARALSFASLPALSRPDGPHAAAASGTRQGAMIRDRHGMASAPPVRLFPRKVDAVLLGGLNAAIGESYVGAKSIRASYRRDGRGLYVSNLRGDGRKIRGRSLLSNRRCSNSGV